MAWYRKLNLCPILILVQFHGDLYVIHVHFGKKVKIRIDTNKSDTCPEVSCLILHTCSSP